MTPIEWLVLFAVCVAGVAYITWGTGKYAAIREQPSEVDELKRQRSYWTRRFLHESRAKRCVIREARRWKDEAEYWKENCKSWEATAVLMARTGMELSTRLKTEKDANNRAFDAGVRAHATGVVNYTGDEPEGVRL